MKKITFKVCIIIAIIVFILLLLSVCPLFNITEINVTGINKLVKEDILNEINLTANENNLFAFNSFKAKKILYFNPYIEDVKINKSIPNKISIDITERKIRGYVFYMGTYLYIDGDGRVIDVQSSFTEKLPIVVGLNFNNFTLGEILKVDNQESFDIVVELSKLITKYELLEDVVKVDVSKPDDIHLYINNVDILFGDFSDSNWKIGTLVEIMKEISQEDKGFLDISDSNKTPLFTYLT